MTAERPHDPAEMAADERIRAVAEILAAGLLRLRAKRFPSRINDLAETSLDFGGGESVSRPAPRRRRGGGAR